MAKKKVGEPLAEQLREKHDADDKAKIDVNDPVYRQGRDAKAHGISKDDAPYDVADKHHAVWLAGYEG